MGADKGERRDITFPCLMSDYNLNMHGTDITDQTLATYKIGIENRKYYMKVFNWILQVCVASSWLLHLATWLLNRCAAMKVVNSRMTAKSAVLPDHL